MLKSVFAILAGLAAVAAGAGAAFVYGGWYDVSATVQHKQPVYSLLELAMHRSVRRDARALEVPASIGAPATLTRGALCYRQHCVQCHGGPGVARDPLGMGMQPVPGPLIDAARTWHMRELYWITRNGIRMSGMPAWRFQLGDGDLWAVAAFVTSLPDLSPADYAERMSRLDAGAQCRVPDSEAAAPAGGDAERGRVALFQYACNACHTIPGVVGSQRRVGPPLDGIAARALIAGRLANTHDNLVAWIRDPQRIDPRSAMPDLGVTARDGADMAAYLATLR